MCQEVWIESHIVDAASIAVSRRRRRVKTDRLDGETLVRTLFAYKRGELRVCSMVRAPTRGQENRHRICRERKTLVCERTLHINRVKGLLFSQGITDYKPLRSDRRKNLEALKTGDGCPLPPHLKAQISRELDRLELLLEQIKSMVRERDALVAEKKTSTPASPAAMLLEITGIGPEFAVNLYSEGLFRHFPTGDSSLPMQGCHRRLGEADRLIANRAFQKRAILACERGWSSLPGSGCAISHNLRSLCGLRPGSSLGAVVSKRRRSSHLPASCWSHCGSTSPPVLS